MCDDGYDGVQYDTFYGSDPMQTEAEEIRRECAHDTWQITASSGEHYYEAPTAAKAIELHEAVNSDDFIQAVTVMMLPATFATESATVAYLVALGVGYEVAEYAVHDAFENPNDDEAGALDDYVVTYASGAFTVR